MTLYIGKDAAAFYGWSAHDGVTEAVALHPEFKPGPEHRERNRRHKAWPITRYLNNAAQLDAFVRAHIGEKLVAVGHNQRPEAFLNSKGYPRSAREGDIRTSRQLFIDIDPEDKAYDPKRHAAIGRYLDTELADYYRDQGFMAPVIASSGNGWHAWIAYPRILVAEHPDIVDRHRKHVAILDEDHGKALAGLEARIDPSVCDLRRVVKVYGTAKPGSDRLARWPENAVRGEDRAFLDYLLDMDLAPPPSAMDASRPVYGPQLIQANGDLPSLFLTLLKSDTRLNDLWHGRGKAKGDVSRSGYDFSLVRRLLALGYRDIDGLATVLATRPDGAVRQSGKREDYIRRSIAQALLK